MKAIWQQPGDPVAIPLKDTTRVIHIGHRVYSEDQWARRQWILRPIVVKQHGGKSFAGFYHTTDAQEEAVYKRYLQWLQRQRQADQYEG